MALFPQSFIEDLRHAADIVQIVEQYVPLRRAGATYKGLCPFHAEKTPSFQVNRDKGFFHCFGCHAGGDVFKFVQLHEKVGFQESVKLVAARVGMALPELEADRDRADQADRETLLKAHEVAAEWFRAQLAGPGGARARQQLAARGMTQATLDQLGVGLAPPGREGLKRHLTAQGFPVQQLLRAGLLVQRDSGEVVDRFRNRLMIPICRDSGPIVAFGGRAMDPDQVPKYLNSPETPIYSKGRTLFGLHLSKNAIRSAGYAVLVEGYFDFAQLLQAGIGPVVASSGTALTQAQAQLLRRFTERIVLSFDPDAAGQEAAVRSCDLLVGEGFAVNVALLPPGGDPDTFVRERGADAYGELLRGSQPYLEFLLDRAARRQNLRHDEGRRAFLAEMLTVAARIPDAAARDQFADRLAHRARITEEVVRSEIRKAAVARRTSVTERQAPSLERVKPAERGLIWGLLNEPAAARAALAGLEEEDVTHLATRSVLLLARSLHDYPIDQFPAALLERLSSGEAELVTGLASEPTRPAPPEECVRALRLLRWDRERAELQQQIDRLRREATPGIDERIEQLGLMKIELKRRIEALGLGTH